MKYIFTILLFSNLTLSFGQHFHPNLIDSLTKKSDFILVVKLLEHTHAHRISVDLMK